MLKSKPQMNLDRPLSWSQISCFEYNKEEWYTRYVLGEKSQPSREMEFGKEVGKKLETDPSYLPMIPRHSKMEHEFVCSFGGIHLVGYADTFCDKTFILLGEYKTGKKKWDQKRVDSHGQIDMYLLMNWIINKVRPEDVSITLVWMPTMETNDFKITFVDDIEENIKIFTTKRTMKDILNFGIRINKVFKEMQEYALAHR